MFSVLFSYLTHYCECILWYPLSNNHIFLSCSLSSNNQPCIFEIQDHLSAWNYARKEEVSPVSLCQGQSHQKFKFYWQVFVSTSSQPVCPKFPWWWFERNSGILCQCYKYCRIYETLGSWSLGYWWFWHLQHHQSGFLPIVPSTKDVRCGSRRWKFDAVVILEKGRMCRL